MTELASIVTGLDPGSGEITIKGVKYNADEAGNFTIPADVAAALFALGTVREVVACATADLPTEGNVVGKQIFDTTRGRPVWWDGDSWVDPTAPPATMTQTDILAWTDAPHGTMVYCTDACKPVWRDAVGNKWREAVLQDFS